VRRIVTNWCPARLPDRASAWRAAARSAATTAWNTRARSWKGTIMGACLRARGDAISASAAYQVVAPRSGALGRPAMVTKAALPEVAFDGT